MDAAKAKRVVVVIDLDPGVEVVEKRAVSE